MERSLQWDSKCPACSGQPVHTPNREWCQNSLFSQIQLLICNPVKDTFRNQTHAGTFLPPLLICTLQASNSASHKVSAVAIPSKAVLSFHPILPVLFSGPPRVCPSTFCVFLKPFSIAQLCCCLPTALKHYGHSHHFTRRPLCTSISYLCCDILLQSFTCRMTNHQLLGSVKKSLWLKPPPTFTQQMSLLSLCSYPSQCK